jgi:hypothetical protein
LFGSKDSASARARELPRMGAKTASRLGCGPNWEQRESEGARELLADWMGVVIGNKHDSECSKSSKDSKQNLTREGCCPDWEQRLLAGFVVVPTGSRGRVKGLGSC